MKKPTKVIISFDTEDFTSDRSNDAILELAHICESEGVRGHFALVGLVCRELIAHKRWDVLDALRPHVVGTHTYGHSLHPDICELTDEASYEKAYRQAAISECEGLGMIRAATGRFDILYGCPPGNSKSYVAMYLYADLGIPFYCDTVIEDEKHSDVYYCNCRQIGYTCGMEGMFFPEDAPPMEAFLDQWARKDQVIVYCHPNMIPFTQFWDGVNYNRENKHPYGQWEACTPRDPAEIRRFYDGFRRLLKTLKADPRFCVTDLETLRDSEPARGTLKPSDIPTLRNALREKLAPVNAPFSLSVADIFQAAVRFLRGESEYVPGKVYGFLDAPRGITAPVTVTAAALRDAAAKIDLEAFIPPSIEVDGQPLGPADFLYAALDLLSDGSKTVTVTPREQLNSLADFPQLINFAPAGKWVHTPDFHDDYLSDRLRLQAWTLRYVD